MRAQDILNYVLILLLFSIPSFAATYDDVGDYTSVSSGIGFASSQSVSGVGFSSAHSCINADPELLQAYSSGSGSYSHDSTIRLINSTASDPDNGFISTGRNIELQENTSFTYSPILLAYGGTFRSGPVKSLWDDSITTGNGGGAFMKVGFDNTRVLSRDVHTKVSGYQNVADIFTSSGEFHVGMKFDAAFNGNEKLGVSFKESGKETLTKLMDEYYSGTYRMTKNLGIDIDNSIWDYGETSEASNAINWLPCSCNSGWDEMDLTDQMSHSARDFFDCTSCMPAKMCSNASSS